MNCNCNENLRIGRGNDFTIEVELRHPTVKSVEDFDLKTCTDIQCAMVSRIGKHTELKHSITDDGKLRVEFDESVPAGVYGFEAKGKTADGKGWRFYAKPGEWLEIVNGTSEENDPEPNGKSYYDKDVTFGVVTAAGDMVSDMKATMTAFSTAESERTEAEKKRESDFNSVKDECIKATVEASAITEQSTKIVDEYNKRLKEHLKISLSGNNTGTPIDGLSILVRSNDDNSVLYEFEWNGTPIELDIPDGTHYNIYPQYAKGYSRIKPRSFTAIGGYIRNVVFKYVWNGEIIEDADVDVDVKNFLNSYYLGELNKEKIYNVHLFDDNVKVISQWQGTEHVSGYTLEDLRVMTVEWKDKNLATAVLKAKGCNFTYGELIDLPSSQLVDLLTQIDAVKDENGNYLYTEVENIDELMLARFFTSIKGFQNWSKVKRLENRRAASIGEHGLQGCTSLTTLNVPNLTSIGEYGLQGCTSLTTLNVPNLTSIDAHGLQDCTSLTTLNVPNLTSIATYIFNHCISLTTLVAPKLTSIGSQTFGGWNSLSELILGATPPNSAGNASVSITVFVPDDAIDTYKAATAWKAYKIKGYSELKDKSILE